MLLLKRVSTLALALSFSWPVSHFWRFTNFYWPLFQKCFFFPYALDVCTSPLGMRCRSDVSFRSHIGRDITDQAETSSRHRNRYVNETNLFETYLQHLTGTQKKLTYLKRHSDVPIDTWVRLTNLTHRRDVITDT